MSEPNPKQVELAIKLMQLGISQAGVAELLTYDLDLIERQLTYLPFRRAKRPAAFIIDAIKNNYSAPNTFPHAAHQNQSLPHPSSLDQNAQPPR
jgi:hypothetical protein